MTISELIQDLTNQLNYLGDVEVIIRSEHPWKFLREVGVDKVTTIKDVREVVVLK